MNPASGFINPLSLIFPGFHSVSPFSSQVSAKGGKAGAGRDKLAHSSVTRRRDGGRKPRYCQRWRELFGPHAGVSVEYIHRFKTYDAFLGCSVRGV